jgi:hypothetical protein
VRLRVVLLRAGLLFGAVAATAVAWAAPAGAAYPPPPVALQLSTSVATPGQTIGVTGEGCAAGSTVTLTFMSTPVPLGTTVANSQGQFSTTVTIPVNATLGAHEIVATCGSLSLTAALTVVASTAVPAAAAPHAPLPFTGWDTRGPLLAGLVLLILGTAAVLVSRSRRHRGHA